MRSSEPQILNTEKVLPSQEKNLKIKLIGHQRRFENIEFYRSSANLSGCVRKRDISHMSYLCYEVFIAGKFRSRLFEVTCSKPRTAILGVFWRLSIDR